MRPVTCGMQHGRRLDSSHELYSTFISTEAIVVISRVCVSCCEFKTETTNTGGKCFGFTTSSASDTMLRHRNIDMELVWWYIDQCRLVVGQQLWRCWCIAFGDRCLFDTYICNATVFPSTNVL